MGCFLSDGERVYNDPEGKRLTGVHIDQWLILKLLVAIGRQKIVRRSMGCAHPLPQLALPLMVAMDQRFAGGVAPFRCRSAGSIQLKASATTASASTSSVATSRLPRIT
jgi:hypothetical protein